ncbi:MAG: hypothetical protein RLZZ344_747 [Pseudomonadota bacterium]|jgi:hypothetical protein
MRILRSLTISKEPDYPESNEDVFFWTATGSACAMSDGASESFDSRTWGRLLCEIFTQTFCSPPAPPLDDKSLREIIVQSRQRFLRKIAQRRLSWSQQAAFDRGNFASLLGVIERDDRVEVLAIGDSVALWKDPTGRIHSHVLQDTASFKKNPVLLSSDARGDAVVFQQERHRWSVRSVAKAEIAQSRLFLMTDALGCFAIEHALNGRWAEIEQAFALPDRDFSFWINTSRLSGALRKDDTTLAIVELS